jgi:hypothetical protein
LSAACLLAGGLVVVVSGQRVGRDAPPAPGHTPPFVPGALTGVDGSGAAAPVSLQGGAVLLYVDDGCPFCTLELDRWYRASGGHAPAGLKIVRHARPGVAHPGVVPGAWAARTVVDRSGAIAAALGVTAVPFLAVADPDGTVVEATLGLTPQPRILTLLTTLAEGPGKGTGHE